MDLTRNVNPDPRRRLPGVDRLSAEVAGAKPALPEWAVTAAAREVVEQARAKIQALLTRGGEGGRDPKPEEIQELVDVPWVDVVAARAARLAAPHPRPLLNATGVVLHTNLGRSPLSRGAAGAAAEAAAGYSDLELDLESGKRGKRLASLERKLCAISGAEAATVVNNNAAAVLLALNTLAQGREVVVSRGELVEIGGSFRVPAIMERAGVKLVEVGTTNRTHPRDYEEAIGPDTALLLKVHRSNFEQRGFVAEVGLAELAEIGRVHGLPVLEDLGAGTLVDLTDRGFPSDAFASARIRQGADIVCFSGDKLLGGPQAGIVLGAPGPVAAMRTNPLARALRLDTMTLAALGWTLDALLDGRGEAEIPALRMMLEPADAIERRARTLLKSLEPLVAGASAAVTLAAEPDRVPVGGGSLPGFELDTWTVAIRSLPGGPGPQRLATGLRRADTPVIARIRDDALLIDLRTLAENELADVAEAVGRALR